MEVYRLTNSTRNAAVGSRASHWSTMPPTMPNGNFGEHPIWTICQHTFTRFFCWGGDDNVFQNLLANLPSKWMVSECWRRVASHPHLDNQRRAQLRWSPQTWKIFCLHESGDFCWNAGELGTKWVDFGIVSSLIFDYSLCRHCFRAKR